MNCEGCPFHTKTAGCRGNPAAPIVFVGESPGVMELRTGKPFMGPSGKVLESCFPKEWQESEEHYFITNAMNCLPLKGGDVGEAQAAVRNGAIACRNRLLADIQQHPRKVIVALGNGALWSITGAYNLKITQERGRLFHSDLASIGVVAAVHPAFLLRGGGSYSMFKQDIEYALDLLEGAPTKQYIEPKDVIIAENEQDVEDFLQEILATGKKHIAADIETGGFNHIDDEILCIGLSVDPEKVYVIPEHLIYLLQKWFDTDLQWIWHNGKFDIKFLWQPKYGVTKARVDHDTMLLSYALNEIGGIHDLDQVASDYLGAPFHKAMLDRYLPKKGASYRTIPRNILYSYLGKDVSKTLQMFFPLRRRVDRDAANRKLVDHLLIPASGFLARVENRGLLIDPEKVKQNAAMYNAEMQKHENALNEISAAHGGYAINPASPAQVADLLYGKLKLGHINMGTGKDVLKKLPRHPAVVALENYRKAAKAFSTYVKPLMPESKNSKGKKDKYIVSSDGRVHTSYLIHGTITGRLSSRGPNLQNVTRGEAIRGQYVAAPGRVFLEFDYNQAELRCLAALSRDSAMCKLYIDGEVSIHEDVSIALWGPTWKERHVEGTPTYYEAHEEYMRTKALNFGIVYGREAPSIAEEFDVPVKEAMRWIEGWAKRFPGAWGYIAKCRAAPLNNQNLITPFGRRKRIELVSREMLHELQNKCANFPHQSVASDLTLDSGIRMEPQLAEWDTYVVNPVHDSLLMDAPDDEEVLAKVYHYVIAEMERTPTLHKITQVPFKADAKRGKSWGGMKGWEPKTIA